ncbi:MAG: hypothetical protein P4L57_08990 [Rhizomicrobium sp.]|nr:hypothetical protein [Rhizomicrobium sp.]
MTIELALPIGDVSHVYKQWQDAPVGTILAFAGRCVVLRHGQVAGEVTESRLVVRAKSPLGPALASVSPDIGFMFGNSNVNSQMIENMVIASGPALNISAQVELALTNLTPSLVPHQKQSGSVIYDTADDALLYVIDYPGYADKGLVLKGQDAWSVVDIPIQGGVLLGTLCIKPRRPPADSN